MLLGARQFFERRGGVNFVPSVESDGTACVVIPHVHQYVDDTKVRVVLRPPNNLSKVRDKNIFGYSKNDSKWGLNNYNTGYSVEFQLYSYTRVDSGNLRWQTYLPSGSYHEIVASRQNGIVSLAFDGSVVISVPQSGTPVTGRFGLLTQNDAEGDAVNPIRGRTPTGVSVSEFDTWDGGSLVTSLRPCIDNNGVVCFFDLVTKSYVYSATGGAFTVSE